MSEKVNLAEKLALIDAPWSPRVVGELNGQYVKLCKIEGEFVWHNHAEEDEMFYVVEGSFDLHLRDRVVPLEAGEFYIVPRGVEHKPVAKESCQLMVFEPASTLNTGDRSDLEITIRPEDLERL